MRILLACSVLFLCNQAPGQTDGGKSMQRPQDVLSSPSSAPLYFVTRVGPTGTEERISPPYLFPVRSKAYLNVLPAQDGHLAVFTGPNDKLEEQALYFPATATEKDSDLVRKGENIKIPVTLDGVPGETMFTVAVLVDDAGSHQVLESLHGDRKGLSVKLQTYLKTHAPPPQHKGLVPLSEQDRHPRVVNAVTWDSFSLVSHQP
jgi:hypothetical protein